MRDWLGRSKPGLYWLPLFVVVFALLLFIFALVGEWPTRLAWLAALVAVGLMVLVEPKVLRRISVELGTSGLKLSYTPEKEPQEAGDAINSNADDLSAKGRVRAWRDAWLKLESKITFLAKHTLPEHLPLIVGKGVGDVRPYASVGSLVHDGYIDQDEAELCEVMMRASGLEFAQLPEADQVDLLEKGQNLAGTIRARVFRRIVLEGVRSWGYRADRTGLNITVKDPGDPGDCLMVRPTWGSPGGELVDRARAVLTADPGKGVVVLPIHMSSEQILDDDDTDAVVATFDHLRAILEREFSGT